MSLVAYGSSDESDESDQEEVRITTKSVEPKSQISGVQNSDAIVMASTTNIELDPPISDEDDDFMVTDDSNSGLALPPPKNESRDSEVTETEPKQLHMLQALPKPKSSAAETGFLDNEEGELEDFVKQKKFEALQEKPPPAANVTGKKRKLVQITVPELPVDSDEEDESSKKQLKTNSTSKKKCGLFDVLPAPKSEAIDFGFEKKSRPSSNVEKKEVLSMETESAPQTNVSRKMPMFVPASLTRKSTQSSRSAFNLDTGIMMAKKNVGKPGTVSSKGAEKVEISAHKGGISLISGVSEESDEEGDDSSSAGNFFSLASADEKTLQEKQDLSASSYVATASVSSLPAVSKKLNKDQQVTDVEDPPPEKPEPLTFTATAGPELQDAPLQFKSTSNAYSGGQSLYSGRSVGPGTGSYSSGGSSSYSNAAYNYANMDMEEMDVDMETEPSDGNDMEGILHDKEFLKMQGKGKHGGEEINIIDVRQDDQISNVDVMKGLSEETNMMSHSKKKNKDMPSSQQKKKHQITYLAFRAKERELELKNQWADNRSTKKQTQAKYGF